MDQNAQSDLMGAGEKQVDKYVYNYRKGKVGKGSYGTVYKGTIVNTKEEIAIKNVKKKDLLDKDDELQLLSEIKIMQQLESPNIVQLYDVLQTENNYYIIMEYCDQGDLDHLLFKKSSLSPQDHYKFLIDILHAFITLIQKGIVHRDLKPANVLVRKLNKQMVFKLADFGFARRVNNYKKQMLESKVGTPLYMSPQLLAGKNYTSKSDIWSLAFIVYQMIYLKTPWTGRTEQELLFRIENMELQFPQKPSIGEEAKSFIKGCLQIREQDRFSWDQIYTHPYVAQNFVQYIEVTKIMENKITYIIQSLREKSRNLDLNQLFFDLDTSGDMALNIAEFTEFIKKIDRDLEPNEIQMVFNEFDSDGNGDIDFAEFKRMLQQVQPLIKSIAEPQLSPRVKQVLNRMLQTLRKYETNLYQIFQKYDTSKNGSLDREELKTLLLKIDGSLDKYDIEAALEVFDENGDQEIQFNEFKRVFDTIEKQSIMQESYKPTADRPFAKDHVRNYFSQKLFSKEIDDEQYPTPQLQQTPSISLQNMSNEDKISVNSNVPNGFIETDNGAMLIPMMLKKKRNVSK